MKINWDTEPLAIVGLVKAVLAVGAGAGLVVSDQTTAGIVALVAAAATVASTIFNRSKVDSPATTAAKAATAEQMRAGASAALAVAGHAEQNIARLCPTTAPAEPVTLARDPETGWPAVDLSAAAKPNDRPRDAAGHFAKAGG